MRNPVPGLIIGGLVAFLIGVTAYFQTDDMTMLLFAYLGMSVAFGTASMVAMQALLKRVGRRRATPLLVASAVVLLAMTAGLFFLTDDIPTLTGAILLSTVFATMAASALVSHRDAAG